MYPFSYTTSLLSCKTLLFYNQNSYMAENNEDYNYGDIILPHLFPLKPSFTLYNDEFSWWTGNVYEANCAVCQRWFKLGTMGIKTVETHTQSGKHTARACHSRKVKKKKKKTERGAIWLEKMDKKRLLSFRDVPKAENHVQKGKNAYYGAPKGTWW